MIVHPKFIFVHCQKTGGSFTEQFLNSIYDDCRDYRPKHIGMHEFIMEVANSETSLTLDWIRRSIKFGCVRNPWAWYVSWWYANSNNKLPSTGMFPDVFTEENINDFGTFLRNIMTIDYGNMSYIEFPRIVENDFGVYSYRYRRCFYSLTGDLLMDHIIRTDNINLQLATILDLHNAEYNRLCEFPKKHVGSHKPYWEYYEDDELIELVRYKDRFIIDNHGFKFGEDY